MSPDLAVDVGIGLIRREGRFLVRIRPARDGSPMPGVWEFPGGKCEDGESLEDAVQRECREETGILVRVLRIRREIEYRYPHGLVRLAYFDCECHDPQDEPGAETGFVWIDGTRLPALTFPEANQPILQELADLTTRPVLATEDHDIEIRGVS